MPLPTARSPRSSTAGPRAHLRARWAPRALAGLAWMALAVGALGAGPACADRSGAPGVRDRPLPERWQARRLDGPEFDGDVYVVEAGDKSAPPVLLVHGLGQSGYQDWWEVIDDLETDFRVVALDLPGFGRSDAASGPLSPPRYARLLAWLHQRLGLDRVRLVGHSMGAAVALYYAGAYPEDIDRVVLADVAGVLQRVAFLRGVLYEQQLASGLPGFLAEGMRALVDDAGGLLERLVLASDVDAVEILRRSQTAWDALLSDRPNVDAAVSLLQTDFSGILARFDRPATLIWGSDDQVVPRRTGHLLDGALGARAFHLIPGAGHTPMRSHSARFLQHLRRALTASATRSGGAAETAEPGKRGDRQCNGRSGETITGTYDRVILADCPGARLVDVRANQIRVIGSSRVRLRRVRVQAPEDAAALVIRDGGVMGTDVRLRGAPAVRLDAGRLDVAGGRLVARKAALVVERPSTVVMSVTRIASGRRAGYLHGATRAGPGVIDRAPALVSHAPVVRKPPEVPGSGRR